MANSPQQLILLGFLSHSLSHHAHCFFWYAALFCFPLFLIITISHKSEKINPCAFNQLWYFFYYCTLLNENFHKTFISWEFISVGGIKIDLLGDFSLLSSLEWQQDTFVITKLSWENSFNEFQQIFPYWPKAPINTNIFASKTKQPFKKFLLICPIGLALNCLSS